MTSLYEVNVAYLTEVKARLDAGSATASDLAALSKGLKLLEGNSDWQAIVAGIADAAVQEIGDASDSIAAAANTIDAALGGGGVVTGNIMVPFLRQVAPFSDLNMYGTNQVSISTYGIIRYQSPVLFDRRNGKTLTFMVNYYRTHSVDSGPVANQAVYDYRVEWGYYDDAYNWTVISALASASSYTSPYYYFLPLKLADGSATRVCLIQWQSSTALKITRWDGTSATLFTSSQTPTNQNLVYDRTNQTLYFHDNSNFIKCNADAAVADTTVAAAGAYSAANWVTAFSGDRTRFVDITGEVDTASTVKRFRRAGFWAPTYGSSIAIGRSTGIALGNNDGYAVACGSQTAVNSIPTARYRDIGQSTYASSAYGYGGNPPIGPMGSYSYWDASFQYAAGQGQVCLNADDDIKFEIVAYYPEVDFWQGTTWTNFSTPYQHQIYLFWYLTRMRVSVADETGRTITTAEMPFQKMRYSPSDSGSDYWYDRVPFCFFMDTSRRVSLMYRCHQVHAAGGSYSTFKFGDLTYLCRF